MMKKSMMIVAFLLMLLGVSHGVLAQGTTAPEAFNVADYENIYPDLLNVYGLDTYDATIHWMKLGTTPGRPPGKCHFRRPILLDEQFRSPGRVWSDRK
jgi:hypothetical protein